MLNKRKQLHESDVDASKKKVEPIKYVYVDAWAQDRHEFVTPEDFANRKEEQGNRKKLKQLFVNGRKIQTLRAMERRARLRKQRELLTKDKPLVEELKSVQPKKQLSPVKARTVASVPLTDTKVFDSSAQILSEKILLEIAQQKNLDYLNVAIPQFIQAKAKIKTLIQENFSIELLCNDLYNIECVINWYVEQYNQINTVLGNISAPLLEKVSVDVFPSDYDVSPSTQQTNSLISSSSISSNHPNLSSELLDEGVCDIFNQEMDKAIAEEEKSHSGTCVSGNRYAFTKRRVDVGSANSKKSNAEDFAASLLICDSAPKKNNGI